MKIVFIGATPQARVYKQVIALKRKYKIEISLICFRYDEILFKGVFDKVTILPKGDPFSQIVEYLNTNKLDVIHLFSDKLSIANAIIQSKIPYIFDPYDYFLEQENISKEELLTHWRIITSNANAILLRYDENIKNNSFFKQLNLENKLIVQMYDYCLEDYFIKKLQIRENRIVHIGYVSKISASEAFSATKFHKVALTVAPIIPYDIFCSLWSDEFELLKKEYITVKNQLKDSFNLYPTLSQQELNKRISSYKYGSYIHDPIVKNINTAYIKCSVGNKIFNYLEAGLPIITTSELEASSNFVKKYKIGFCLESMYCLKDNIKNIELSYKEFLTNCYEVRENQLNIMTHIYKLYELYCKVRG